ncbi:hypothetical protein LSH36_285g02022 [Paralvinella palmiformis]|uniref:BZIP domain-containing protein n=1 Tax=Paralvinella palmiformis TaxID=53620 RepID=A0AAD9JIU8_9ANNE|nr:hypothetical protein LSH36_285g02022 [Paralvinella palmiformis]
MMETMESSFYHDNDTQKGVKSLKSSMTLDFTSEKTKQRKLNEVLNSPDINMLKLASPELERLIIQQGGVTTTPTPNTQILFPKSVTEEQEAYARGFVDALAELHQKKPGDDSVSSTDVTMVSSSDVNQSNGLTYATLTTVSNASNGDSFIKLNQVSGADSTSQLNGVFTRTTIAQLPDSALPQGNKSALSTIMPSTLSNMGQDLVLTKQQTVSSRTSSPAMQYSTSATPVHLMQVKEEPQRVPSLSPHLAPIDMDAQESIKLERKRARNRIAARKCRTRKLERISRLEERVDDLKGQNSKLVQTANDLREQVFALKQQILEHVNSGCKVMLSANML